MRYLSFGAGVQTTAILFLYPKIQFEEVIFADTGAELPETYEYIDRYIKPFIEENGLKFTVVRGNEKGITNLEDYCLYYRIMPSVRVRWCTSKYKLKPIFKYLESKKERPITAILGISYEERHRVIKSPYDWHIPEYPLVSMKMTRDDCKKVIVRKGYAIPPRSGCYFCPFQTIDEWKDLYIRHPKLYERAIKLEENGQKFNEFKLMPIGISLREFRDQLLSNNGDKNENP